MGQQTRRDLLHLPNRTPYIRWAIRRGINKEERYRGSCSKYSNAKDQKCCRIHWQAKCSHPGILQSTPGQVKHCLHFSHFYHCCVNVWIHKCVLKKEQWQDQWRRRWQSKRQLCSRQPLVEQLLTFRWPQQSRCACKMVGDNIPANYANCHNLSSRPLLSQSAQDRDKNLTKFIADERSHKRIKN